MADQGTEGVLSSFLRSRRFAVARPYLRGDVLDVGCGSGALAALVDFERYVGVDVDEESLRLARRSFPRHRFQNSLPSNNETFDSIAALAMIEHVADPSQFLGNLALRLDRDSRSRIVCTTPHPSFGLIYRLGTSLGLFSRHANEEHLLLLDRGRLGSAAEKAGLELLTYRRFLLGANQIAVFGRRCSEGRREADVPECPAAAASRRRRALERGPHLIGSALPSACGKRGRLSAEPRNRSRPEVTSGMMMSYGLQQDGVIAGNVYGKYGTRNPLARVVMRGFSRALSELVEAAAPVSIHDVGVLWVVHSWPRPMEFKTEIALSMGVLHGSSFVNVEARGYYPAVRIKPEIEGQVRPGELECFLLRSRCIALCGLEVDGSKLAGPPRQVGYYEDCSICSDACEGSLVREPYVLMGAGEYRFSVRGTASSSTSAWVDVVSASGCVQHAKFPLSETSAGAPDTFAAGAVTLKESVEDLEVRVCVGEVDTLCLDGYGLTLVSGNGVPSGL